MIGKFFNKKKSNDGFYLQIDETTTESTPAAAPVEVKAEPVAVTTVAVKEKKAKTSKSKKAKETTVSTTPKAMPQEEVPIWVQAINKATAKDSQKEEASFATSNLMPAPTSRRRPGPSMSGFLDMARQVK
jgi:predicted carbohydrate-binding protein with CBM5 and CBM33 domain